jgi:transposase
MAAMARLGYCFAMTAALDPARLSSLPADLRAAFEAQAGALAEKASALDAERLARQQLQAEKSDLEAQNAFLKQANFRLEHLVREFRRAQFGPRAEKLGADQLPLAFEDVEVAIGDVRESIAHRTGASRENNVERPQQRRSRALPKELPRIERVIEPASIACPCGCGTMVRIERIARSASTSHRPSSR